jgi:hypothetical protein
MFFIYGMWHGSEFPQQVTAQSKTIEKQANVPHPIPSSTPPNIRNRQSYL